MTTRRASKDARGARVLVAWLGLCAALAFALIVLGGVVRLTRAGLSITEWQPIAGALPPWGAAAWDEAFAKYRATPEFQHVNRDMDLAGFRTIFLLEYAHRLLGRVTGLALAAPLVVLLARRRLTWRAAAPLLGVLAAGAAQAALGWWMVKSGLVSAPHVSPARLAGHLVAGIAIFGALVWMLASALPSAPFAAAPLRARVLGIVALAVATITVAWGGLMAGTHAGLLFPTFPKMAGVWMPVELASLPAAATHDAVAIHFLHRALALALALACAAVVWSSRRSSPRARLLGRLVLAALAAQVTLGALVVILHVPIVLASLHQACAVVLVGLLVALARHLVAVRSGAAASRGDAKDPPRAPLVTW